jgi:hypothetical protein
MSRDELVTYLLAKADAFENHPVHVDMSDALRQAAGDVQWLHKMYGRDMPIACAAKPDIPPPAPGLQSNASRNRDPGADQQ